MPRKTTKTSPVANSTGMVTFTFQVPISELAPNVSEKYPQVTLNTTYSFGIDDQDFMLAFECDNLRDFQNLIMDLRQTPVSAYVAVDTPMITCVKKDIVLMIFFLE